MKKRIIVTSLLAAAALFSLGGAALADTLGPDSGTAQQTITLTAPATQMKVTVPTSLAAALTLDADQTTVSGTATSTIRNDSALPVKVSYTVQNSNGDITVTGSKDGTLPFQIAANGSETVTYNISCSVAASWEATTSPISVTYTVDWA